ncbi:MAG: hypothetical protein AB8C46_15205 [Burkholderiaceae bacterium]
MSSNRGVRGSRSVGGISFRLIATIILGLTAAACGGNDRYPCAGSGGGISSKATDQGEVIVTGILPLWVSQRAVGQPSLRIDPSTEVMPAELVFDVQLQYTFPSQTKRLEQWHDLSWLLPSAHACSPPFVPPKFSSKISNAELTSDASMGAGFDAGRSLAAAFVIEGDDRALTSDHSSDVPPQTALSSFGSPEPETAFFAYIVSASAENSTQLQPTSTESHRFTFTITLDDGQTFSAMSEPVLIRPPA